MSAVLTQARYKIALDEICAADSDLASVVASYGPPPIWRRPAGFRTLLYLILEQQVSLASARATYEKLVARLGAEPEPDAFLNLTTMTSGVSGFRVRRPVRARPRRGGA